jgi:hypothetical protein
MKPVKVNFLIPRGDAYFGEDRLSLSVPGDWSSHKLSFGVKIDKEVTGDLLIRKRNTLAGGGDQELTATYENNATTIKISLNDVDSQSFTIAKMYYDVIANDVADTTKTVTIAKGELKINFDVQNNLNGIDLPESAKRLVPIFADNFLSGQFIRVQENEVGLREYIGTYDVFGIMKIDENGNLTIDDNVVADNNFTIDKDGDVTIKD